MTCMCILLNPGIANLPVASIDVINESVNSSVLCVTLTMLPLSIKMLIPGVSLPSWVLTTVTPSNRSLPDMGSSTFGRGCLWQPKNKTAKHINVIPTFKEDRDIYFLTNTN